MLTLGVQRNDNVLGVWMNENGNYFIILKQMCIIAYYADAKNKLVRFYFLFLWVKEYIGE
jgi:hypothetical protein